MSNDASLRELSRILEARKGEWGSNVRVIGLVANSSEESLINLAEEIDGFSHIENYLVEENHKNCKALLGIDEATFGIFLDKDGKIAQRGNPFSRYGDNWTLEKDFEDLLAGNALTGSGVEKIPWED